MVSGHQASVGMCSALGESRRNVRPRPPWIVTERAVFRQAFRSRIGRMCAASGRVALYLGRFQYSQGAFENRMSTEQNRESATLAGGCFWCLEAVYKDLRGAESVVWAYAGGAGPGPTS